jgi:hypothetical protein
MYLQMIFEKPFHEFVVVVVVELKFQRFRQRLDSRCDYSELTAPMKLE